MALSKYRKALEHSLKTKEEKEIIKDFYKMSYADFLGYYSESLDTLIAGLSHTRLKDRPYQGDNIRHRSQGLKSGEAVEGFITQLPAGAGKTEIFLQTLLKNAREVTVDGEVKLITPPTVILVPSEDLLNQVCDELHKRFPNLVVGKRYGKETNIQPLTVCIYNSFIDDMLSGFIHPSDIKLAVLDEAHRGLSDTRYKELKKLEGIALLDMYSASPAFDANKNLYELLPKKSVIPSPSDAELTEMGHLAPCHNVILRIKIRKEDVPPEIAKDSQKYGDFLQRLKIQAAIEFYKNYEDPETGQRAFGKPVVGFTRYVRDAQEAERLFGEELANMAANDKAAARILKRYTHHTQTLSRSLGNEAVDVAFDRILPLDRVKPERRKNPPERALMTFTSKMAREGTDVPDWKVALGIQTGTIVDEIQTRGRVRRKKGDELSIVLDCIIEEDGKILGDPIHYAKAICDPNIIRGVFTYAPGEEQINSAASDLLEFKNREEMQELVLGSGTAAQAKQADFDKLWRKVQTHIYRHSKQPQPEPFMLDGDPVKYKIVAAYDTEENGTKKSTELRISRTAIDQFRKELGIPGQLNSLWLGEKAFEKAVIGTRQRAKYYQDDFRRTIAPALKHFSADSSHPYILKGRPILMQSRLDDDGNLVPAFHHTAILAFKEALDILPGKTQKFLDFEEFSEAVLDQVDHPRQYQKQLSELWKEAQAHYKKHHKPGQHTNYNINGYRVEVAQCLDNRGDIHFCIERKGVRYTRRYLGITDVAFDIDGVEWSTEQSDIIKINRDIDGRLNHHLSAEQFSFLTERGVFLERGFLQSIKHRFDSNHKLASIIEFRISIPREAIYEVTAVGGKALVIDNSNGIANELAQAIRNARINCLSPLQFSALTGRSDGTERIFLKSIKKRFDSKPKLEEIVEFGVHIPRDVIYEIKLKRGPGIVIDNTHGVANALAEAIKKAKTNYLTCVQFGELSERGKSAERKFLQGLKDRFDKDGNLQEIVEFGVPIPRGVIYEIKWSGQTNKAVVIDNSSGIADRLAAAIKKSKHNRLSIDQFASLSGRSSSATRNLLESLDERFTADPDLEEIKEFGVSIPRKSIYRITAAGGNPVVIDDSEGSATALATAIKNARSNFLSADKFALMSGRGRNTERLFIQSLKAHFDADPNLKTVIEFGVQVPRKVIYEMPVRGGMATLIDNSEGVATRLAAAIKDQNTEKGDDDKDRHVLKSSRPQPRRSPASLTEDERKTQKGKDRSR